MIFIAKYVIANTMMDLEMVSPQKSILLKTLAIMPAKGIWNKYIAKEVLPRSASQRGAFSNAAATPKTQRMARSSIGRKKIQK